MKLRTVIEGRDYQVSKIPVFILAIIFSLEALINNVLPFTLGFFFAVKQNLFILFIWFLTIIFNIRFNIKKDDIEIKIIRGF